MRHANEAVLQALRAARKARRLSQRALGAAAGMPQSHISKIEAGGVDPKLSSLIELARTLEMDLVLVPRKFVPAIRAIVRGGEGVAQRPAYSLDDEDDDG